MHSDQTAKRAAREINSFAKREWMDDIATIILSIIFLSKFKLWPVVWNFKFSRIKDKLLDMQQMR